MIIDLPDTTTGVIARRMMQLADEGSTGSGAKVLTLIVVTEDRDVESAVAAANKASGEHPCRVITVGRANRRGEPRLDAQIRFGGEAGASEVLVLRLYGELADAAESVVLPLLLPDAPVVAWWPGQAPDDLWQDPIGQMATRRITDAAACSDTIGALTSRCNTYQPGDTDLAWTRTTRWRALLAAALDIPPYEEVEEITVEGGEDSPSAEILAAWLHNRLQCPVTWVRTAAGDGLVSVRLKRASGDVFLKRTEGETATLEQPGQPTRQLSLQRRETAECIAEELRRLDPDDVYGYVITSGLNSMRANA